MSKIQSRFSSPPLEDMAVANPCGTDRNHIPAITALLRSPAIVPDVNGTGF